jgi:hypothetical protein
MFPFYTPLHLYHVSFSQASKNAIQNRPNCNTKAPVKKHGMGKGLMTVWRATNPDVRDLPVGFGFADQEVHRTSNSKTPTSINRSQKSVATNVTYLNL